MIKKNRLRTQNGRKHKYIERGERKIERIKEFPRKN